MQVAQIDLTAMQEQYTKDIKAQVGVAAGMAFLSCTFRQLVSLRRCSSSALSTKNVKRKGSWRQWHACCNGAVLFAAAQ